MYTVTHGKQQTLSFAENFSKQLKPGDVIAFKGGLGAGKTAFCEGLAAGLGCTDTVSSPTFSIVNVYGGGRLKLAHFDMYRVQSYNDLCTCGFYDYIDEGAVLAVEWSENIAEFLEKPYYEISIEITGDEERKITVSRLT